VKCNAALAQRQTIIANYRASYSRQTTDAGRNAVIKSYESAIKANDAALAANHCPPAPPAPPLGTSQTFAAQTYTVQPGDNLSSIALRLLGNANRYVDIAEANQLSNPSLIRPGQVLRIPSS
jgi:nucleoid-associated protein YgaU